MKTVHVHCFGEAGPLLAWRIAVDPGDIEAMSLGGTIHSKQELLKQLEPISKVRLLENPIKKPDIAIAIEGVNWKEIAPFATRHMVQKGNSISMSRFINYCEKYEPKSIYSTIDHLEISIRLLEGFLPSEYMNPKIHTPVWGVGPGLDLIRVYGKDVKSTYRLIGYHGGPFAVLDTDTKQIVEVVRDHLEFDYSAYAWAEIVYRTIMGDALATSNIVKSNGKNDVVPMCNRDLASQYNVPIPAAIAAFSPVIEQRYETIRNSFDYYSL